MPIILATQEAEIRQTEVRSQPRWIVLKTLSQKYKYKKGLVKWLKVKTLNSNPSTGKKNRAKFTSSTKPS
jgi:hypothetical protein